MKKCIIILVGIWGWSLAAQVAPQEGISLDSLFSLVEKQDPMAEAASIYAGISTARQASIRAGLGPGVRLAGQASWQSDVTSIDLDFPDNLPLNTADFGFPEMPRETFKLQLEIQQPIYQGGRTRLLAHEASADHQISLAALQQSVSARKAQAMQLFFSIQLLKVSEEVSKAFLKELDARLQVAGASHNHGSLPRYGKQLLEAEKARINQQLTEIRFAEKAARETLVLLAGDTSLAHTSLIRPEIARAIISQWQRPELAIADLRVYKLQLSESLLQASKRPGIAAFSQLGYGKPGLNMFEEDFSPYALAGLKLEWVLWDNYGRRRKQEVLRHQQSLARQEKARLEEGIQASVLRQQAEIEKFTRILQSDEEIVGLREEISRAAAAQLDEGVITPDLYVQRSNEAYRARLEMETHLIQLEMALAEMNFITGKW